MPASPEPREADGATTRDAIVAVKTALTLGASLIATWSVALVVRLFLPRHLGPELFGVWNFAESFTATFFIVLGMGVDTYIQKEIPVRPAHASDFLGGVIAARLLLCAGVFAAMGAVMTLAHRPPAVQRIVFIFGVAQLLSMMNATLAALLHATRTVGGLAIVNVASKVLWGVGVALAIALRAGLPGLALAFLAAEVVRTVALSWLTRLHLGVKLRFDLTAIKVVLLACLPIYVNQVAATVYGKVGVSVLAVLSNDSEVGWYGSASNLASLALLVSPLIGSVLLPFLSRAAARSREELFAVLRRSIEIVLLLVIPVSLLTGLGADVMVPGLFGRSFAPATMSLRILAPIFVFTYLAMISAVCLVLLDRAWTVAIVSLVGLVVNPALTMVLVPWGARLFGPGGAGAGTTTALLITEVCATTALTASLGRGTFDRQSISTLGKALLSCAVVVGLDHALRPLRAPRIAIDAGAYVALLFAMGALKPAEIRRLARFLLRREWHHAGA